MYFSVLCNEEIPCSSPEAFEEVLAGYPEFAGFFQGFEVGGLTYGVCADWDSGQAGAVANEPVRSDVPTLVLAGEYDPIAPPAWGEQVAASLPNGMYFLYPGMAHGGTQSPCQQQKMLAFLEDPTSPPDDSCIAEMVVAPFVVPVEGGAVELEPFTSETFGFSGLRPVGWTELAPGVYNRGQGPDDVARLIEQAAPGTTVEQLKAVLAGQLGLDALPDSTGTLDTPAFTWELTQVDLEVPLVGQILVHLALAEDDQAAYIVLLQATAGEAPTLYETVFVPALEALTLPGAEAEPEKGIYQHPGGLFSVPIPTNWTAEQNDGFATLTSPDGEVTVYVLALEAEDLEEATAEGWRVVNPEFDLEVAEVIDEPVTNGAERAITVVYDTGEDEAIIIGGGWLYDGIAYLELFETTLEPLQKRAYQLATISTGYEIAALEKTPLASAEMAPLDEILPELEAYIQEKMDQLEVPGAAIAITQDGQVVYAQGFGVRDLESQAPVTPETLMMIGSSTKPMTTLLMAQLVDQGAFRWDTRVVEVLPTFRVADDAVTDEITMRNLVCACSGVPRRDLEWLFNASELGAEDIVESLADFEFFTDFGEAFQYSNQMVACGGYLAALAAGGEYGQLADAYVKLMQDQVFDAIDMPSTTFDYDLALAEDNVATPYAQTLMGETVVVPWEVEQTLTPVAPAGALWSNLVDISRFLVTALNRGVTPEGERIVSAENLAVTWEPQVDITADMSYGLGWIVEDYHGVPVISHAGNTFGFTSEQAFLPEHGLTISILTNQRASALGQVVRYRWLELLFGQEPQIDQQLDFTLDTYEEIYAQKRKTIQDQVELEAVEPFLGGYANDALGPMTLKWQDGQLIMDVGEFEIDVRAYKNDQDEIRYEAYAPSAVAGLPVELEQGDDGQSRVIFGLGVVEYTYEKAD
jgi:CubicO group peptidase (beta-lactamase class C family)